MSKKAMRCAAYVRVSREEQVEGFSLQAQERQIQNWVDRLSGEPVAMVTAVYRDEGLSGRTDDRPGFQQMIADARSGLLDAIVVHKFDRLARNREDAVIYKALLRKELGVKVFSVTEPSEDSDSSMGVLIEGMLEVVAHWYSLNLAAETRKGKRQKAEQGLWHGATPTGYCNGKCLHCKDPNGPGYCPYAGQSDREPGKVLIPHPVESEAIRLAFQWYATGKYSDRDIAHKLNSAHFRTDDEEELPFRTKFYRRKGSRTGPGPFEKDTIKDILTRPFYAGRIEYYGTDPRTGRRRTTPLIVRQGEHQPLIPLDLFQKCQDIRQARGKAANSRAKSRQTAVYPLAGIVVCNECGAPMRASSIRGTRYYRCRTRIQRREGCSQLSIRAAAVEAVAASVAKELVLTEELEQRIAAYLVNDQRLEALDVQKRRLQAEFKRAQELYMDGDIERSRYERAKSDFEREMAQLCPEAHIDMEMVGPLINNFGAIWTLATPLERKGLLATIFREIRVQDGAVVGFDFWPPFDRLLEQALLVDHIGSEVAALNATQYGSDPDSPLIALS